MVVVERRMRILAALSSGGHPMTNATLCAVAASITELSGAGVMLMSGDYPEASFCTTNPVSALIEDLQYSLGEGPCVDCYSERSPVLVPDLSANGGRWPAFVPPVLKAGAKAIFGFPIVIGAIRLGALNLYRDRVGDLTDDQYQDAVMMADVAARAILLLQANAPLEAWESELTSVGDLHLVVHQAAGMVSVQLETSITVAMVRMRAWSFANDLPLVDMARALVERRLIFDLATGEGEWNE